MTVHTLDLCADDADCSICNDVTNGEGLRFHFDGCDAGHAHWFVVCRSCLATDAEGLRKGDDGAAMVTSYMVDEKETHEDEPCVLCGFYRRGSRILVTRQLRHDTARRRERLACGHCIASAMSALETSKRPRPRRVPR